MTFKIEIRKDCKICGGDLPPRGRTYCSKQCRNKVYTNRYAESRKVWAQEKRGEFADNKIKCLICGRYYRQVGSHITQKHGMTARQYREEFDLEVKRGILPSDLREKFAQQALENGTYKNLEKGKRFRFKRGQPGVGVYKRSPITLQRLSNLGKTYGRRKNKNRQKVSKQGT